MVLKAKSEEAGEESVVDYQTVGVHVGHYKSQSVATLINKKILQSFILPAIQDYYRELFEMLLTQPNFKEFKVDHKADSSLDETIHILSLMYKKYGCLNIPKLESQKVMQVSKDENQFISPAFRKHRVDAKMILVG